MSLVDNGIDKEKYNKEIIDVHTIDIMFTIYTGFDKEFVYLYISSVRLQQTQLFIYQLN